jgi:hypothetical protein
LTSVAGAGKSAIAHTIAKRCREEGLLGSSFFFDHSIEGRNTPNKLFSTIACDLAHLNADIRRQVVSAIKLDRSIATAPISRQFDELLCGIKYSGVNPVAIVIDGLDEAYDADLQLLAIFRDKVPRLSSKFRIFMTSRPVDEIVSFLSQASHIRREIIDIHEQHNLEDIAVYSRHRLGEVASLKRLPLDWPGRELTDDFIAKAEGLFIWVATVSRYLSKSTHPDRKLVGVLSGRIAPGLPAEKMDELYSIILGACDWTDDDFARGYHLFMGTIMAAKNPISLSVLQSLNRATMDLQATEILAPLGSLLSGLDVQTQPIRVLHLSLQDFLTSRSRCIAKSHQFYLDNNEHNQRLALSCSTILNQDLGEGSRDVMGCPTLWYACRFWVDHVTELDSAAPEVVDALQIFLTTKVRLWIEAMGSCGTVWKLSEVRIWIQVRTSLSSCHHDLMSPLESVTGYA